MNRQYDICIVGGGMAGATLACALADRPLRIALLEAVPRSSTQSPSYDDRGLALSRATQRVLRALGVWEELEPESTPMRRIHVSEQGRFGCVHMVAADVGLDAFGHVVVARELGKALLQRIEDAANVDVLCPARLLSLAAGTGVTEISASTESGELHLGCRLLVAADGTHSAVRKLLGIQASEYDYRQTAVVANVTPQREHRDTAFERFSSAGPMALLPLTGGRCVAVCAVAAADSRRFLEIPDADYLRYLESRFGRRLGRFSRLGTRRAYPLVRLTPDIQAGPGFVLLGNAAHTLHPNGAQGFNLAVRDAAALAEHVLLAMDRGVDPGAAPVLDAYLEARRPDQERVLRFSDGLARLFCGDDLPRRALRRMGMLCTEFLPPLKRRLVRGGMGLWGRQPSWVCGREL